VSGIQKRITLSVVPNMDEMDVKRPPQIHFDEPGI